MGQRKLDEGAKAGFPAGLRPRLMPYTLSPASPELLAAGFQRGGENRWTLNFGPQHPATHTTLRLVLELDGERVVRCTPHIGYLHSGFEKLGEHLNYNQYVTIVDRMDYSAPIYNELPWHGAAEKLMGIEITPRCKALRTIAGELGRIQSHLLCVGAAGLDLGAFTAFLYGFNERETIYDIFEFMSGQRFHTSWTRVGGLNMDLPDEAMFQADGEEVRERCAAQGVRGCRSAADQEPDLRRSHQRRGRADQRRGDAWSMTGPMARASGVRRDIRKDEPYLCFADNWDGKGAPAVDFKVPVMRPATSMRDI
jgi:NADH-quinone oxidoreductase subunit D